MSAQRYNSFIIAKNEDRAEMEDMGLDFNAVVSEAVPNMLAENKWVGKFLKGRGVIDVAGRLADDIAMACLIDLEDA